MIEVVEVEVEVEYDDDDDDALLSFRLSSTGRVGGETTPRQIKGK